MASILALRRAARLEIYSQPGMEDERDVMAGMAFGFKSGISTETTRMFRALGVSHLLAVSGLHTALLAQAMLALLRFLKTPRKAASLLTAGFVLLFVALTGFTPSAVRAGVMSMVMLLGLLFGREPDSLNSLGLALLVIALPIQLFTVFYWSRNKSGKKVAMKRLGVKSGSLVLGASAAGWLIGWLVFSLMNDFNAPLSSLTFVVGLLASLLAMLAYVESCFVNLLNYAVSTVMNILLVIESLSNLTYLIIGVYGILQSVRSCMIWIGLYRAQKREKEISAEDALQEGEDTNGKGNI